MLAACEFSAQTDLTPWYDLGYTPNVKTAISIPDSIYRQAEKTARRLRISRSRLYSTAIQEYLRRHADGEIVERLNAVYGSFQEAVDPVLAEAQSRSLPQERW